MYQKIGLFFLLFFIGYNQLLSQQTPLFTQYREYHSFINPASINSDYIWNEAPLSFGISSRTQWANQAFTPRTFFLRGEYVYNSGGTFGLVSGGYIIKDNYDPFSVTGVIGRIGVLTLGDKGFGGRDHHARSLSIGFSGGILQYRLNTTDLITPALVDETINTKATAPELGVGIFYQQKMGRYSDNAIYFGLSSPQILGTTFEIGAGSSQASFTKQAHYYGLIGYYKSLGDATFLEPSIWISYLKGGTVQIDANLRYQMSEFLWLGFGYGSQGVLHFEAGVWIGGLDNDTRVKIGYGIDNYLASYGPFFGPSYEINVGLVIGE